MRPETLAPHPPTNEWMGMGQRRCGGGHLHGAREPAAGHLRPARPQRPRISDHEIGYRARILPAQITICSCEETINEFEMLTRNAGRMQLDTLKKILEKNADAEYLRQFGLGGRTDAKSYKSYLLRKSLYNTKKRVEQYLICSGRILIYAYDILTF